MPSLAVAARAPLANLRDSVLEHECAMVRQDVRVFWNFDRSVFEGRFVTRHVFAVPGFGEHHLHDSRSVTLRCGFGEILAVAARIHCACGKARNSIRDIEEDLLLVAKRDVAKLDHHRRAAYEIGGDLQQPDYGQIARAAEVFAAAGAEILMWPA